MVVVEAQMSIGIVVMAHEKRREQALALRDQLGASVVLDDGSHGENKNGDRAWGLGLMLGEDWTVVLQDDAIPVPDFRRQAESALAQHPDSLVSFYVGTTRPKAERVKAAVVRMELDGAAWMQHSTLLWGVGVGMPTKDIDGFLSWAKSRRSLPYDERLGAYFQAQGSPVYYTYPSLVDHADEKTLVRHKAGPPKGPRRAWRVGVPQTWNTKAVTL